MTASPLAAAAVVIPTVLRPSLLRAARSVFAQDITGGIHLLIGIDQRQGDASVLDTLRAECPAGVTLTVLDLGYSTARRHGGFYPNAYSGALRTILSYAANSRHVAYLDDDDWWAPDHLSRLRAVIAGKDWAFSYRWMVDAETGWPICPDEWDSVGPDRGINQERFGGFVCPSTLMLDKDACHFLLPYWSLSPFSDGTGEDRLIFRELLKRPKWAASEHFSSFYELPLAVQRHPHHAREFAARGIGWMGDPEKIATINRLTQAAATAFDRGDRAAAEAACRQVLALQPYHAPALTLIAACTAGPHGSGQ